MTLTLALAGVERERHRHLGAREGLRQLRNVTPSQPLALCPPAIPALRPPQLSPQLSPPSALHSALSRTIARYLTHWTLVLQLLYLWLAVYSTYMAIYDFL